MIRGIGYPSAGPGVTTGVIECKNEAGAVLMFTSGSSPDEDQLYGNGTTTLVPNDPLDATELQLHDHHRSIGGDR